jgi:hypothetical protein
MPRREAEKKKKSETVILERLDDKIGEGRTAGRTNGLVEGRADGRTDGRKGGREEGRGKERKDTEGHQKEADR